MKTWNFFTFLAVFLFIGGIFPVNAQDLLVLRDGTMIEAQITEISSTEIRYKRFDHLDGPTIVVSVSDVFSIRYENGTVETFNTTPAGQTSTQTGFSPDGSPQLSQPTVLQSILNSLPAIPIAGNTLKFEFGGESWVARVNGENFSAGTIEFEETAEGGILTLRQTHIWPGAVGRTAGNVANMIPGGGAVGGALNAAGSVAGALGPIETSGEIVLEYRAGPPASLRLISTSGGSVPASAGTKTANARNNWISVELATQFITHCEIGLRYERMLSPNISLGVNAYYCDANPGSFFEANAFLRLYPSGKTFFLGVGLGYSQHQHNYSSSYAVHSYSGIALIPEIGWKFDLGQPGGFYIMPCISVPIVFVLANGYTAPPSRVFYLGMGVAF